MSAFDDLVASLPQVGLQWHKERILENSKRNVHHIKRTIRDIQAANHRVLVVSAGPSLYRETILSRLAGKFFDGVIVCTDGAYVQCLKHNILPDYVLTLDPHPTRMVRWFGDPDYSETDDDYFKRQDLDVAFREDAARVNAENIRTVDENKCPLVICTTAPQNVVERTAGFLRYWFAPLVDTPVDGSLTKAICEATGCPALNTGGTVGTAAILFAQSVLGSQNVAVVGMDLGYYSDTPLRQTQSWNMMKDSPDLREMYPVVEGPLGPCYTDATYAWYKQNLLDLLKASNARITNCSGHGALFGDGVEIKGLEEWLNSIA